MPRKAFIASGAAILGPYSHAIDSDGLILLSSQSAYDSSEKKVVGDIREQTARALDNLFYVLKTLGLTPDDVQKVTGYLVNMGDFSAMNEVYEQKFSQPYPARTTVGVNSLPMGALVEFDMVARKR